MHPETERLTLRPWTVADAEQLRLLIGERGGGLPALEETRGNIERRLVKSAENGIALLPVQRRLEGDFIGYCGLIIGRASLE